MIESQFMDIIFYQRSSQTSASEGLNVLFADLLIGATGIGEVVRVFTTRRHYNGLINVLTTNGIDLGKIEIKVEMAGNWILRRALWGGAAMKKSKSNAAPGGGMEALRDRLIDLFARLLDFSSITLIPKMLLAAILVALGLLMTPLFLAFGALVVWRAIWRRRREIAQRLRIMRFLLILRDFKSRFETIIQNEKLKFLEASYRLESRRLGRIIDSNGSIKCILFTNAFEGYLAESILRVRKVVVFPDLVTAVFPSRYPQGVLGENLHIGIAKAINNADKVICYSNYTRDRQLRRFFPSVSSEKISVIPQGFFVDEIGRTSSKSEVFQILRRRIPPVKHLELVEMLVRGEGEYLIYPSVDRPHKNTITLVKAIEKLLRTEQIQVKLICTSHSISAEVLEYIQERRLEREILFLPTVPIATLNFLIAHAAAVVHPSLAEGGDIFNVSRAVALETPVIVSDILVVREMFLRYAISETIFSKWIFDPYNLIQLVNMIRVVLAERDEFVREQNILAEVHRKYAFSDMARNYLNVINGN